MGQDLFTYVPLEIILIILSRLPARTIMSCKCVCKSWLDLLTTPEFVKSHLSKSVPGLVVFEWDSESKPFKIFEFVEKVDLNRDELHWNIVFNFDLPFRGILLSSANGFLFLNNEGEYSAGDIVLCNPITRDYIKIPCPVSMFGVETYGFGVSRLSCQYKVVRIFLETTQTPLGIKLDQFKCQVYTVGTGSWRGIASGDPIRYVVNRIGAFLNGFVVNRIGAFLNGNLHWLAHKGSSTHISCLDLETELFSTFSSPLDDPLKCWSLSVLGDCLCLCNSLSFELHIWLMKAYGDEKSWTKEFVIRKNNMAYYAGYLCPIKVFKDGDILMESEYDKLLYYSSETKTIQEVDAVFGSESNFCSTTSTTFTPSFLSLKTIVMENVSSF